MNSAPPYLPGVGVWLMTLLLLPTVLRADVALAPLFRDDVVLQRDQSLPIWGRAAPGEKVTVSFHDQSTTTLATEDGRWRVTLSPLAACKQEADLVVTGNNTIKVTGVVVGDLWLCSGQSNMEIRVRQAQNASQEIAEAQFPSIRQFKIPHAVASSPATDCAGTWVRCTPDKVGEFTAVGYFFARDWSARTGVPVGLINSSWGATQIESWMSEATLQADPAAQDIQTRWKLCLEEYPARYAAYKVALVKWNDEAATAEKAALKFAQPRPSAPEGEGGRWQPAGMYHAMIAPLTPMALCGVLWYQGESNCSRSTEYRTLFPALIQQWRADFAQPQLPFYFVQLASYEHPRDKTGETWASLREAQVLALRLPATGMVVTIDIGDRKNIHPINKQEVGRRLALVARAQLLHENMEYSGPVFTGLQREGTRLRLTFNHAEKLVAHGDCLTGFELAGDDHRFVAADARIEENNVVVSSTAVRLPVAVRYAWSNYPVANLFNQAALPATPFRSDDGEGNW